MADEARSGARLHHTNIVPVFGVGEEGGLHYYVMQYITGTRLDAVPRSSGGYARRSFPPIRHPSATSPQKQ
jgi:serine/threonine protein kinase